MLTNDNIVNFITDMTFVILETQEELEAGRIPPVFFDFVEETCIKFSEEDDPDDLFWFDTVIGDYMLAKKEKTENHLIFSEWELMRSCVSEYLHWRWKYGTALFEKIDLGRPSDEYIIRVCIDGDMYELLYYYGISNGYDYAMKPLNKLWNSAAENELMFEFSDGCLDVYTSEVE